MNIEIRNMTASDLADADRIFCSAFESPTSRIEDISLYFEIQPEGRFIGLVDGEPVATVAAIDYGPFAYIGSMGVLKEWQRHGLGRAMMDYVLEWLDRKGCPVSVLDASPFGYPLYAQLGFEIDELTRQYKLAADPTSPRSEPEAGGERRGNVRPMVAADLPVISGLDTPIFGANREKVLARLFQDLYGRAFVAENDKGELTGYMFAKPLGIGPFVAQRVEDAAELLETALSLHYDDLPAIRIPSTNIDGIALIERLGFQELRALPHMRRGGTGPVGDHARLYGLYSYAIG